MSQDFANAIQLHSEGKLDEAELIYRQILDELPEHSGALHLLGVVFHQRGKYDRAVDYIKRAIAIAPDVGGYYTHLAEAYRMSGNAAASLDASRRAVALAPHSPEAHNQLGLALHTVGKYSDAVVVFRDALDLRPEFALAHNNLGLSLRELDQHDAALNCYREAVKLAPTLTLALSNLGQALLEIGEKDEAEKYCREAVRLDPTFAVGLSNLGNVLRAQDNLKDAKDCYRQALKMLPNVAMIHGNLGQALQQEGHLEEAIKYYNQATTLDPTSPRFESYLASALCEKEDYTAAAEHYRKALALKPDFPEALNGLGTVLLEQGDFKGAVAAFEETLRKKPDFADAYSNLAGACSELGDLEKATHYYREAIRCDPDYTGAYAVLATHLRDKMPDSDIQIMKDFLAREHLNEWKRSGLHHGLAHYYDAKKDYALAADHAAKGNQFRREVWTRQSKTYVREDHASFIAFLIKQFQPSFFERVRGWGLETETPVFIIGLPRSGTTLLEQILGSHSRMFGAGELPIAKDVFDLVPKWMNMQAAPAVCMPTITKEIVQVAAKEHMSRLRAHHATADRIVDKMPDNYMWLGFLTALFPKAKFIYSKRDVHDIAVSCWITNFKQIRWACDQEDIAGRIKNHLRLMDHWKKVLPAPILEVEYEQTVEDLEGVARKMIEFCGLEWEPACLAFHESKRTVRTASLSQVRQPVYKKSVQRWRNYEEALKPLFTILDT
jgi:tetratricopeptide (TPR) repeat protein